MPGYRFEGTRVRGMKRCPACLQGFEPKRSDAVYCKPACRLRAYRIRAANSLPQPGKAAKKPFPGVLRPSAAGLSVSSADPKWVKALKDAIR